MLSFLQWCMCTLLQFCMQIAFLTVLSASCLCCNTVEINKAWCNTRSSTHTQTNLHHGSLYRRHGWTDTWTSPPVRISPLLSFKDWRSQTFILIVEGTSRKRRKLMSILRGQTSKTSFFFIMIIIKQLQAGVGWSLSRCVIGHTPQTCKCKLKVCRCKDCELAYNTSQVRWTSRVPVTFSVEHPRIQSSRLSKCF